MNGTLFSWLSEYHDAIEGQPGLRAVPVHELVDAMPVAVQGVGAGQTVQRRCSGVLQIGKTQFGLRLLPTGVGGCASASWLRGLQSTKPCWPDSRAAGSSSIQANLGHKADFIEFFRSEASQVVIADLACAEQPGEHAGQDGVAVIE